MGEFRADGPPRTKGNMIARCPKGDKSCRPMVMEDNVRGKNGRPSRADKLRNWSQSVRIASRRQAPSQPFSGAVRLRVDFYLPRPACRASDPHPSKASDGDLDKLLRGLLDALQTKVKKQRPGHMMVDDAQVVEIVARKLWAKPDDGPGATIDVIPLEQEQEKLL